MSVPLTDLHVKYVVDFTLRTVLGNPERYLTEIFGDAKLHPLAALLGDNYINKIKNWFTTTNIPVVLGFELDAAQIPGVTIHLKASTPVQPFMGDVGFTTLKPIQPYERNVIVPEFSPTDIVPSSDGTYITITPPATLDPQLSQLIIPGFHVFDKNKREYGIEIGPGGSVSIVQSGTDLLTQADLSQVTVVTPYPNVQIRGGVMYFDDSVVVACHGHADRNEGLWLWAIVQWGLLKYRPLLTAVFGLDLALPTANDFSKDDSFLGENVWTRYVTLTTKSVWSWSAGEAKDFVAFISAMLSNNVEGAAAGTPPANPGTDTNC